MSIVKNNLRCVVVGLGRIGWDFHIPQIMMHDGFELAAVVDPDAGRLEEARNKFGVKILCSRCEDLPLDRIDLAIVASPTLFHLEQVTFFLENGVDVFCEKPIGTCLAEARSMVDTARKNGRRMMVYQPHRLTSECLTAQKIIESGKLGRIFMIHRSNNGFSRRNDWQARKQNGGGMLLNYGAHYIDQMLYFFNDTLCRVRCETMAAVTAGDAEDVVQALLKGNSGILYRIDINQGASLPLSSLALYGTYGTAMTMPDGKWKVRRYNPEEAGNISLQEGLAAAGRRYNSETLPWIEETVEPVPEMYDDYYIKCREYFAEGKESFIPLEQTLELMRAIEECRKSAETSK